METRHQLPLGLNALGRPLFIREAQRDGKFAGAIGRWRHHGAEIKFQGDETIRLIFNLTGGQIVDWRSPNLEMQHRPEAGAIALACPTPSSTVKIEGFADTVQIVLSREMFEDGGTSLKSEAVSRLEIRQRLQALAVQALVSGGLRADGFAIEVARIAQQVARIIAARKLEIGEKHIGGLSARGLRRVRSLVLEYPLGVTTAAPTVGEMAAAAGLSPFHFIRSFQKTEGMTPHAWLIALRLDQALRLLLEPNGRLGDIAELSGFTSLPYFIDTFRRRFGVTPGSVRKATFG